MRKAKIVCTIGPVTSGKKAIESLITCGMDVARLNFSHGDYHFHEDVIKKIRNTSQKLGKPVAILQDLQGIKIRVGKLKNGKVHLVKGETVRIQKGDGTGDEKEIYIDYPWLMKDAHAGDVILIDDGLIMLQVTAKKKELLTTTVLEGGVLRERKGVNLPHMKVSAPFFTAKDRADLEFGITMGVDYVALSFVRSAEDIRIVKKWLIDKNVSVPIIAKIEKGEAIDDIENILEEVEGIMVARGDLGVEMPLEEVPMFQKMLIKKANEKRRLVITATQMLESMTGHSHPTRAETNDVANAVIDETDALMLSAETSAGKYPFDAVKVMDRIITFTEDTGKNLLKRIDARSPSDAIYGFPEAVARAASRAARDVGACCIVAFTQSGFTARLISKFRPGVPIIAFSPQEIVVRQMALYWGVFPHLVKRMENTDEMVNKVDTLVIGLKQARKGDRIVIVASHPPSLAGKTNFMKMHIVGESP
ncbi:MAG: pyruvate kinase [Syntrophus sp. (in: bacteria)]|nr:pyruvate kinase [Syntrophus sp. (in: bacteria)]